MKPGPAESVALPVEVTFAAKSGGLVEAPTSRAVWDSPFGTSAAKSGGLVEAGVSEPPTRWNWKTSAAKSGGLVEALRVEHRHLDVEEDLRREERRPR